MANILIIDDDQSILDVLGIFLKKKGHSVSTAASGNEGLELFFRHTPDIVFLDVRLSDRDGLEVLCEIQAEQCSTKVIIMTAFHDMQTTIWAMKNGAFEYIRKPWRMKPRINTDRHEFIIVYLYSSLCMTIWNIMFHIWTFCSTTKHAHSAF